MRIEVLDPFIVRLGLFGLSVGLGIAGVTEIDVVIPPWNWKRLWNRI